MQTTQIQVVGRKGEGEKWEGALLMDGRFKSAFTGASAGEVQRVVETAMNSQVLGDEHPVGTEISIAFTVIEPTALVQRPE